MPAIYSIFAAIACYLDTYNLKNTLFFRVTPKILEAIVWHVQELNVALVSEAEFFAGLKMSQVLSILIE